MGKVVRCSWLVGVLMAFGSSGPGCKDSTKSAPPPPAGSGGAVTLGGSNGGGSPGEGGIGGGDAASGGLAGGGASGGGGGSGAVGPAGGRGGNAGAGGCYYTGSNVSGLGGGTYPLCGDFGGAAGSAAETSYTLTPGTNCFQVTGPYCLDDGCGDLYYASSEMPVTYDDAAGTITFPSLGLVPLVLNGNRATGSSSNRAGFGLEGPQGCDYRFTYEGSLLITGNDAFALAIRETRDEYAESCHTDYVCVEPRGGSCTSSWTVTMVLDPTKTFQSGGCY